MGKLFSKFVSHTEADKSNQSAVEILSVKTNIIPDNLSALVKLKISPFLKFLEPCWDASPAGF